MAELQGADLAQHATHLVPVKIFAPGRQKKSLTWRYAGGYTNSGLRAHKHHNRETVGEPAAGRSADALLVALFGGAGYRTYQVSKKKVGSEIEPQNPLWRDELFAGAMDLPPTRWAELVSHYTSISIGAAHDELYGQIVREMRPGDDRSAGPLIVRWTDERSIVSRQLITVGKRKQLFIRRAGESERNS
ncbi:MAG: hypothetical protein HYX72_10480 [Acidobacteria bacterium]|nr:hypothetical protein [Acidobacteriota bacterium]